MSQWVIKKVGGGDYDKGEKRIKEFIDSGLWTINSFCEVYDIPHQTAALIERTIGQKFLRECKQCDQRVDYRLISTLGNCPKCKKVRPPRTKTKYGTREYSDALTSMSLIRQAWPHQVKQIQFRGVSSAWRG